MVQNMELARCNSTIMRKGKLKADELIHFIQSNNGQLYVVTDYGVFLGIVESKNIKLYDDEMLNPDFIQEVRIFNKDMEIKITRMDGEFVWRERKDKDNNNGEITRIDETYLLWGKVEPCKKGWSMLTEQRGSRIALPHSYEQEQKVGLVFRKYIAFQDWDLANEQPFAYHVVDDRLVEYQIWKEEKPDEQQTTK
ncbi:CRISPR-associated protein [Virgibacillus dokdonensis]|uniref:CRISPR-associated protein n=2 Tax=Virgibacillus dokdonensis TaxID=302167 RepID=A0A3E0WQF5_9BACI|nr:CRISPR-associated protein [Virgibacillus dokdonensis]